MIFDTDKQAFLRHVRTVQDGNEIVTLYGRRVDQMDEEELRAAVVWLGKQWKEGNQPTFYKQRV